MYKPLELPDSQEKQFTTDLLDFGEEQSNEKRKEDSSSLLGLKEEKETHNYAGSSHHVTQQDEDKIDQLFRSSADAS